MRLLHITHQYAPAIGGAEQYIVNLSEEMARRGHTVDVYTASSTEYATWRNVLPAVERINNVQVYRFRAFERRPHTWKLLEFGLSNYWQTHWRIFEPLLFYGNGPLCPGLFRAVWQNAHRYDLIHINQLHYAHAYTAWRAARIGRTPVVITPHIHVEQRSTFDVGYMRNMLRRSEMVFADTYAEESFLLQNQLCQSVITAGVGLQLEQFPAYTTAESRAWLGIPQDAFVILFFGRKVEYKGLDRVIQAWQLLRQEFPNLYLVAFGPETDFSRQLWQTLGESEGILRRAAVSDQERSHALAACDVLAVPSTGEAFGIVYLDAWAYAKPVIGANVNAVASLIKQGVDGYLVDPKQPATLAGYLRQLIGNPTLAQTMGQRGHAKLLRRYTTERIGDIVEGAYQQVLRRKT